jgi:hypothetical protein
VAVLSCGTDHDAEELAELAQGLRSELLQLDVDAVALARDGGAPDGAKGIELFAFGGLVVHLGLSSTVLSAVVETTVAWLGRRRTRSVKLTLDDDTLEVTGISSAEQSRLIEQWVARHANAR